MTDDNLLESGTAATLQFENVNEGRSYPFEDDTELVDASGKELPDDVISDMHLVLPSGTEAYLSSVYVSANMVSLCVVAERNDVKSALSCTVDSGSFSPYVPYRFEKLTGTEDC